MIFLDTSAIYALANERDPNHEIAVERFGQAIAGREELLVHSYVVVEAAALLQARLGIEPSLRFLEQIADFTVHWIDSSDHDSAVSLLRDRGRRELSLVDCASFEIMRRYQVSEALAFDADFVREGFALYPAR